MAKRYTKEEKRRIVSEYMLSGQHRSAFAEVYGISIGAQKKEVIAANSYDELDRLKEKNQHSNNYDGTNINTATQYLQSLDYTYNIRGWLTGINDPTSCSVQSGDWLSDLFSMKLEYETTTNGGTAQFHGNINNQEWCTYVNGVCKNRQFQRYTYCAANRLTAAPQYYRSGTLWYAGNQYSESLITYDLNGNLKSTIRRGLVTAPSTYGTIDQLTYYYDDATRPDRLTRIVDAGNANIGFVYNAAATTPHYVYDNNGNMTQDKHKNYNHLNLPNSFTVNGNAITVIYTADGEKLSKTTGGSTKNYCSGIEYPVQVFMTLKIQILS